MKKIFTLLTLALSFTAVPAWTEAVSGKPAPQFTAVDSNGKTQSLSDYKGKFVVLEWYNPECPFVKKHYKSNNMQKLQGDLTNAGAVWFSVSSSAKEKQGYLSPDDANKIAAESGSKATATLLDPDGKLGILYGAKTTPHIFLINPEGTVVYTGAIDDRASADPDDVLGAKNYLKEAFVEAGSNKPVTIAQTDAYGCGVKYKS